MLSCGSIMTHSTFFSSYVRLPLHIILKNSFSYIWNNRAPSFDTCKRVFLKFLFIHLLNIYWAPNIYHLHTAKASGAGTRLLHVSGHLPPITQWGGLFLFLSYRYMNWGLGRAGVQIQMFILQSWTSWVPLYIYLIPGIKGALIHSTAPCLQTCKLIIS